MELSQWLLYMMVVTSLTILVVWLLLDMFFPRD